MTNDEIRRNDETRMTKPATAQVSFSTFGLRISFVICHSSFVIQRLVQVRFMVPLHGIQVEKAFHELSEAPPGFGPSLLALWQWRRGESARGLAQSKTLPRDPQVQGPNACGKNERGLSMNRPTPRVRDVEGGTPSSQSGRHKPVKPLWK